jgi:hypothetical protein
MAKLAILDFTSTRLLIVDVCDEQVQKLDDEYDNDTESWLCEEGLETKLGIDISNIQYMWLGDDELVQILKIQ